EIFTNPEPEKKNQSADAGIPDHLRYLLSCSFMRHFPVEPLLSSPTACRAGCYRRNAVVVADSKACPDLVVIRSGFCRVMKRLMVNRNDSPRQPDDATSMSSGASGRSGGSSSSRASKAKVLAETRLPVLQPSSGPSYAKIDTGRAKPKSHQFNVESTKKGFGFENISGEGSLEFSSLRLSLPQLKPQQQQRPPPPLPPWLQKQRPPVPRLIVTTDDGRMDFSVDASNVEEVSAAVAASAPDAALTDQDEDKKCVAVEICILKPGDVFGLSDIMFKDEKIHEVEDSASVSLVSNGAECVLLSKAFFIQHAPERVQRRVRAAVQPYPNEQVFEQNYYTQVAWNRYRRTVFKLALNRALAAGANRKAAARSSVK
uniref:Cyclic nucleotide-binding domain-containing protein n=1 Tax=Macrostomum lignano TaxID=282301 RepID=A0A1I8HEB1_9PLAT